MPRLTTLAAAVTLASLAACGPATPAQTPEAAKDAPASEPAASASAEPAPAEAKAAPAAEPSPAEALARDLVKTGGRRIGWSASKKRFVLPVDFRTDGGRGLDLRFYDDEGAQREILRICQPGECEERLDEIVKEMLPKIAGRLEKEGFEAVSSVGWPSGRDEVEVGALGARLRFEKGRISLVQEKKTIALRALGGGKGAKSEAPTALYPVPAAKIMGALGGEFFVVKLP